MTTFHSATAQTFSRMRGLILPVVLVALIAVFSMARPDTFGTVSNLVAIANTQVPILFLAVAATLPFIVGEFDLSVAANATLAQILLVGLVLQHGAPVPVGIIVALGVSGFVGLLNGLAVARFGISSFIATLATASILAGVTLAYSEGQVIFGQAPAALTEFARRRVFDVPLPVFYAALASVVLVVLTAKTPVGRRMYATGSNQRAAQLTGIPTMRYVVTTFVSAGLLAGVSGILLGGSLGSATPDTSNSLLIPAIAAAFLGAAALPGARFNIAGTVVAVMIVGVAVSGLQQLGAALWVQPAFNGVVLFAAIGFTSWTRHLQARATHRARVREIREQASELPDTTRVEEPASEGQVVRS